MEYTVPKTPNQNLNNFLSELQNLKEKASQSSDEVVKSLDGALSTAFEEIYKNIIRVMQKKGRSQAEICEFLGMTFSLYEKLLEQIKAEDKANRVYTLDEIKERVRPVAEKYNLPAVWVFGSYARGEATPESDVDILFDSGEIQGKQLLNVFCDFEDSIGKDCDFLTRDEINAQKTKETPYGKSLRRNLGEERVQIYG